MAEKYYRIHMGAAKLALDLGDGSERGEYVNQDYILHTLGRPHRNINLMYTYYPKDKEWPQRISEACKDLEINFAWDYPYDDYFPYRENGEPFASMQDVRRHGQDVTLTLTIDCSLDDEELRRIARELAPYGRMKLRINHECIGDWFTHNKRFSFKEIADFFVRFTGIIKEEAPQIETIFCAGFSPKDGEPVEHEADFIEAYKAADVWSVDRYLALHYGWPYDVAEKGVDGRYTCYTIDDCYDSYRRTAERLKSVVGEMKPFVTAELNADGDVTSPLHQGEPVKRFAERFKTEKAEWFKAITMYQFRDRGRLGLEIEDPNNKAVGIPQPMIREYKELLNDPYFMPEVTTEGDGALPFEFRWGGAEDADGLATKILFEKSPEFCEITFEDEISLMIELNGRWFYKAPQTRTIDLMEAFFDKPIADHTELELKLFATPADGVNVDDGSADWATNYRATLTHAPTLRIRYEPVGLVG